MLCAYVFKHPTSPPSWIEFTLVGVLATAWPALTSLVDGWIPAAIRDLVSFVFFVCKCIPHLSPPALAKVEQCPLTRHMLPSRLCKRRNVVSKGHGASPSTHSPKGMFLFQPRMWKLARPRRLSLWQAPRRLNRKLGLGLSTLRY
jgi:hypothetical protein